MSGGEESQAHSTASPGVKKSLWQRRVPHIAGLYLAGAYTAFEMSQWVVKRYQLPIYYEDFCLFGLLSMFPAVVFLAYGHGAPGRDHWSLADKLVIPLNLVLTVLLLSLVPRGVHAPAKASASAGNSAPAADPASTDESIEPTPSSGQANVLAFSFRFGDEAKNNSDLRWMQFALPQALEIDINVAGGIALAASTSLFTFTAMNELENAGFNDDLDIPVLLMRTIAKKFGFDYFVTGSLSQVENLFAVDASLYSVSGSKVVATHSGRAGTVTELADQLSVFLRVAIDKDALDIEDIDDLPAAERSTSSSKAFRAFSEGLTVGSFGHDITTALAKLDEATEIDPTFAYAYFRKATLRIMGAQVAGLEEDIRRAQQHSYRLSEDNRASLRVLQLWMVDKKPELALQAAHEHVRRDPNNMSSLQLLANLQYALGKRDEAMKTIERLQQVANKSYVLFVRADVLVNDGRYDEALQAIEEFLSKEPEDASGYTTRATIRSALGEHDDALADVRRARSLDPADPAFIIAEAEQLEVMGRYDEAKAELLRAVEVSRSDNEKAGSLAVLSGHYTLRGQLASAVEAREEEWTYLAKLHGEEQMHLLRLPIAPIFAEAGQPARARALIEAAKGASSLQSGFPLIRVLLNSCKAESVLGDSEAALQDCKLAREQAQVMGVQAEVIDEVAAHAEEKRGNLQAAENIYRRIYEAKELELGRGLGLARVLVHRGAHAEAIEILDLLAVRFPNHPRLRCVRAKAHAALGHKAQAQADFKSSLSTWAEADETYQAFRECKAAAAELES